MYVEYAELMYRVSVDYIIPQLAKAAASSSTLSTFCSALFQTYTHYKNSTP